jgi:phage-related protein
MAIYREADGWYNEDSEGPYTEFLRTKGDWKVFRLTSPHRENNKVQVVNRALGIEMEFNTITEAKQFADKRDEI